VGHIEAGNLLSAAGQKLPLNFAAPFPVVEQPGLIFARRLQRAGNSQELPAM